MVNYMVVTELFNCPERNIHVARMDLFCSDFVAYL